MTGHVVLQDGTTFTGYGFGHSGTTAGRLVFHTGVVGYQEIITNPAYHGLLVVMTYPLIGNVGVVPDASESASVQAAGLIVKQQSPAFSNWQAREDLPAFMRRHNLIGLQGIDTRALVTHLRDQGEMGAVLSTESDELDRLRDQARQASTTQDGALARVTTSDTAILEPTGSVRAEITLLDLGITGSLLERLRQQGCRVRRLPASAPVSKILEHTPQAVILAGGPEDRPGLQRVARQVGQLPPDIPVLGIGSGFLVVALMHGAHVVSMRCGHHGLNQPVKITPTDTAAITIQDHSLSIDPDTVASDRMEVTHTNLNDNTIEGIRSLGRSCTEAIHYVPDHVGEWAVNWLEHHASKN